MTDEATSGFRKALRRVVTFATTLVVFGGAAATVFAGLSFISANEEMETAEAAPQTAVSVLTVDLVQGYTVTRRFTGRVEAAARTDLGFKLSGRITEVLVEEGDVVSEGTVLARLDTSALIPERAVLEAEMAALAADAELARLTLARNDTLTERGFRSSPHKTTRALPLPGPRPEWRRHAPASPVLMCGWKNPS
jgi:membrane fusion protein, multidrug efflux system